MDAALTDSPLHAQRPAAFHEAHGSGARSKFRTIVADPPWAYKSSMNGAGFGSTTKNGIRIVRKGVMKSKPMPYPTMSVDEICALPVRDLAEDDSHLYLWTTQAFLRDSYRVMDAWGYKQGAMLIWSKPPMGVVGTYVCSVEFCIFGRRGNLEAKRKQVGTCYQWPRSHHSAKPEAFQDMVESVSPGPYLEMFARRNRLGWSTWGNECLQHVTLVPPNASDQLPPNERPDFTSSADGG